MSDQSLKLIFHTFFLWKEFVKTRLCFPGYLEVEQPELKETLTGFLEEYKKETKQDLSLVFFKEAVIHCARLCRVLSTPGGHSFLLSTGSSLGRATLVRLAAFMTQCKVSLRWILPALLVFNVCANNLLTLKTFSFVIVVWTVTWGESSRQQNSFPGDAEGMQQDSGSTSTASSVIGSPGVRGRMPCRCHCVHEWW